MSSSTDNTSNSDRIPENLSFRVMYLRGILVFVRFGYIAAWPFVVLGGAIYSSLPWVFAVAILMLLLMPPWLYREYHRHTNQQWQHWFQPNQAEQ